MAQPRRLVSTLLRFALQMPEAYEDHPWGEDVAKVRKRVFAFFGHPDYPPSVTVKLPRSGPYALSLGCCEPTGYGLGRSGWVTVHVDGADAPAAALLREWIEESYQAVAPKALTRAGSAQTGRRLSS